MEQFIGKYRYLVDWNNENVRIRLPKTATAEQMVVSRRRLGWLSSHPGEPYPSDLNRDLIALNLWHPKTGSRANSAKSAMTTTTTRVRTPSPPIPTTAPGSSIEDAEWEPPSDFGIYDDAPMPPTDMGMCCFYITLLS